MVSYLCATSMLGLLFAHWTAHGLASIQNSQLPVATIGDNNLANIAEQNLQTAVAKWYPYPLSMRPYATTKAIWLISTDGSRLPRTSNYVWIAGARSIDSWPENRPIPQPPASVIREMPPMSPITQTTRIRSRESEFQAGTAVVFHLSATHIDVFPLSDPPE